MIRELGAALSSGDQLTFQPCRSAVESQVHSLTEVSEEHNTAESETFTCTWSVPTIYLVGLDDYGRTVLTLTYLQEPQPAPERF